jgi:hypothetical protein
MVTKRDISERKIRNKNEDVSGTGEQTWIVRECAECHFKDVRLQKRLGMLLEQMSGGVGESIPFVCQDWANTKAAYRFFSNERVSEAEILRGHFRSTQERLALESDSILILHDTTEFSYTREETASIGVLNRTPTGHYEQGRPRLHTNCGILMHSSLAVTPEGLPLGLAAIKFWSRKKFKGTNALKRRINITRVPIEEKESIRWLENMRQSTALLERPCQSVHIGDRESDIYELFCEAQQAKTHFLVRTCVDRLAGDGGHTIADEMKKAPIRGLHDVEVRDRNGELCNARLLLKYERVKVLPPIGKQRRYPELTLTVIHAIERDTPPNREAIEWKLITDLPVDSFEAAIEKLDWYSRRWKIEVFHKILKSGCKAEESKLRTAERIVNLISLFCILSWRIFWMTMINRTAPEAPPGLALTRSECHLLDQIVKEKTTPCAKAKPLSAYLIKIARLGGYLARKNDPPPGNIVMWRGMSRLTDVQLGFQLGVELVGN